MKSHGECVGGYDGLFDMSGNIGEWEDSCTLAATPQDDMCQRRGGDFVDTLDIQQCAQGYQLPRAARQPSGGFRCCR